MKHSKKLLTLAGGLSFAVALFQAIISFSPALSLYFDAPAELVSNRVGLLVAGLIVAVIFAVFGFYAMSGAGYIRPLPFLRGGLIAIGSIYTLRGLVLIPELLLMMGLLPSAQTVAPQAVLSSLVSLAIGGVYLAGVIGR